MMFRNQEKIKYRRNGNKNQCSSIDSFKAIDKSVAQVQILLGKNKISDNPGKIAI
jgi:hypothetical protein